MKKSIVQFGKFIISAALIGFLISKIDIKNVWYTLEHVKPGWFIGGLMLFGSSHFLGTLQWKRMLRAGDVNLPYMTLFPIYMIGLFFNNFLIGGVGGDFYRVVDVRRLSGNGVAAVSTVFLDRVMGLVILSCMAVISSPYLIVQGKLDQQFRWIYLILIGGWIFVLSFFFVRRFAQIFSWIIKKVIPSSFHLKARDVYNSIYHFGRNRSLFFEVSLISTGVQFARVFMQYLLARGLGCNISPIYFFLFVPIIAVLSSLPITLGGIGMREQSGVLLFGVAGMIQSDAFSMMLLAYFVAVVTSIPGGIWFFIRKKENYPIQSKNAV